MSEDFPERRSPHPDDPASSPSDDSFPFDPAPADETEAQRDPAPGTHGASRGETPSGATSSGETSSRALLFSEEESQSFEQRWSDIQVDFVDQPRESVSQADRLAGEIIDRLSTIFTDERDRLEKQWSEGEQPSTEDLRLTLRRYRSLVDRLLSR